MAKRSEPASPKRESAKAGKTGQENVEPMVIALAEQLGTFLGRVQGRAEGWLDNETLHRQVSQIRDGATNLLKQVNQSGAAVKKTAAKAVAAVTPKAKAKKAAPAPAKVKARSGGTVDAPGKKHRKPPPQQKIDRRMNEPKVQQMGQKGIKGRMQRGPSDR